MNGHISAEDKCAHLASTLSLLETLPLSDNSTSSENGHPRSNLCPNLQASDIFNGSAPCVSQESDIITSSSSKNLNLEKSHSLNEIPPGNIMTIPISSGSSSEDDESDTNSVSKIKSTKKIFKNSRQHPPDPDSLPPCRVCGEKASGLHYGVNTCEPCKGFFRRSIVKIVQNKEEYRCMREGRDCKLGAGKRTMCSYCRYKKCLDVGMSQEAIKIGRYSYSKRNSDFEEVKKLKGNKDTTESVPQLNVKDMKGNTDTPESVPQLNDLHTNPVVDMDMAPVEQLVQQLIDIQEEVTGDFRESFQPNALLEKQLKVYESYQQKFKIFGNLCSLPRSVYDEFHSITGIEIDDRKDKMSIVALTMEKYILNMVKFARNLPGFPELSPTDQASLLKASFLEYFLLELHNRINTELNVIVFSNLGLPNEEGAHMSEFSHITDTGEGCKWSEYASILQKCHFTVEEVTLTMGIILTFTDRCQLEEPEKVEKIQWNLINCLRSICKKNYKNPDERLWQIFDKFTTLRTFAEYAQELNKMKAQWPVMKDHPLVLEVISS